MTRRLRVLLTGALLLLIPALASAFMPAAIEQAVRSWFNGAGKLVGFTLYPSTSTPALSPTNACRLYVASTGSLLASCDGGDYTYLVSNAAVPCTQNDSGVLTCNSFISTDQDGGTGAGVNALRVYRNTTTARTCAANGVANELTIIDSATSGNKWCLCDGTTELVCWVGAIPDCQDSAGKHLNYTAATGTWTCGTS